MKILITCTTLMLYACAGCCNIMQRCDDYHAPYVCAKHPYYCTASVWSDCVCAPFAPNVHDPIWSAFATLTWPFWLVDEVCEAALDTVFLPVDGIYALCRNKPEQSRGETEKVQEAQ